MKKFCLLFTLCVLSLCLVSCGNQESAESAKRLQIAVIPKGTTHEFWKSVHAGAIKAARELNVDIIWKGPLKEDDRDAQISVVEDFISRGVDGICLAPLDDTALCTPVKNAVTNGISIQWYSAQGRLYTIDRSTALPTFNMLTNNIPATPLVNTFVDTTATGPGPYYYRIRVQ